MESIFMNSEKARERHIDTRDRERERDRKRQWEIERDWERQEETERDREWQRETESKRLKEWYIYRDRDILRKTVREIQRYEHREGKIPCIQRWDRWRYPRSRWGLRRWTWARAWSGAPASPWRTCRAGGYPYPAELPPAHEGFFLKIPLRYNQWWKTLCKYRKKI